MFHHTAHTLQDKFIGYPDTFIEPPLGSYVNEQFAVQVAKADTHRFTFYRTDFLPGTDRFSPIGASRFNIMYAGCRLVRADHRRMDARSARAGRGAPAGDPRDAGAAGQPMLAERVVIGPSPYPGAMGVDAANNITNTINRGRLRPATFPLPPTVSASMGVR